MEFTRGPCTLRATSLYDAGRRQRIGSDDVLVYKAGEPSKRGVAYPDGTQVSALEPSAFGGWLCKYPGGELAYVDKNKLMPRDDLSVNDDLPSGSLREPLPRISAPKRLLHEGDAAWKLVCETLARLAQAGRAEPSHVRYYRRKAALELWRPTADCIQDEVVVFDGAKYDRHLLPSTRDGRQSSGKLVHEHAVPRAVLSRLVFDLSDPSPLEVSRVLSNLSRAALLTPSEDARLNDAGLRSAMPAGWDGRDPWARYRYAGIELFDADGVCVCPGS